MTTDAGKTDREKMLSYLRRELVGPRDGDHEDLAEPPHRRYIAGVLYPQQTSSEAVVAEEEPEAVGLTGTSKAGTSFEDQGDDPITLANQYLPSSMGISFYLRYGEAVEVEVDAGVYKKKEGQTDGYRQRLWQRVPGEITPIEIHPESDSRVTTVHEDILNGTARVHSVWRPGQNGWLVTITLINRKQSTRRGLPAGEDCIYQAGFRVRPLGEAKITAYPRSHLMTDNIEEQILELLYRNAIAYGAGHGCSVAWDEPVDGSVQEIRTEMIPVSFISPLTFDIGGSDEVLNVLSLIELAQNGAENLKDRLDQFVDGYGEWIIEREDEISEVRPDLQAAAEEVISRLWRAEARMREGIHLLTEDDLARTAFILANQAMLMQRIHSEECFGGRRKPAEEVQYIDPGLVDRMTWRPFQLAFQLLALPSIAEESHPDRDIVDLIWFPTGGGKTEAYLAVAAFHIFHRRLRFGDRGAGTTVIMRYTLRLLTAQQFRRASTLICACERIRQASGGALGTEEISIGFWVGQSAAPNRCKKAYQRYQELLEEDRPRSPFQVDWCPWCGTELVPSNKSEDESLYGIRATPSDFELYCPNETCPFHNHLPVQIVDDELYKAPPTLLLATVDKFARLPWEKRAGAFFGDDQHRAPELIIQDELHLISGPLGTMVGVYEMAIEALASWQGAEPKILASTATIRRADEQTKGLYARHVELFPPSGLEASDSYFAKHNDQEEGRMYVGVMGQGHTGSTNMIRVSAALLQAPVELDMDDDMRDAYWTLVAYHNSLRELGKTLTFAADDIPARIKVIAEDQENQRLLSEDNVVELTSNLKDTGLGEILERLDQTRDEDESVSFLACTNMLSVGVDVQRLGLMLVNGQPKSTSEYIQATSRVGRGVPGLVVCLFAPTKPRDRSHYERFCDYHQALYRYVEPTSVTPFALPARNRALHAVLVALVRHKLGLNEEMAAGSFEREMDGLAEIKDFIINRATQINPAERLSAQEHTEYLISEWHDWARAHENLRYHSWERQQRVLIKSMSDSREIGWPTLNSMRNVDKECLIEVMEEI